MEAVDSEVSVTCTDMGMVRKVFQLALLCTKRHPSERPTMHEVARVLVSLLPATAAKPWGAGAPPPPVPKLAEVDYERLLAKSEQNRGESRDHSSSDAQWFVKFGEVISKNSL